MSDRPRRINWQIVDPAVEEQRIVDEDTGGAKGRKPQRYELLPPEFEELLSLICGMGAKKYGEYNYLLGFRWSLSVGALRRHLNAWRMGEDLDPESGLHHLGHVAWHAMSLFMQETHGLGKDDRLVNVLHPEGDAYIDPATGDVLYREDDKF